MIHTTSGYLFQRILSSRNNSECSHHSRSVHYLNKFRAMETHFFEHMHPILDSALAFDSRNRQSADIMTIHGCRHVADLIESLDKIGSSIESNRKDSALDPLEAYILLCAAHLHDAGNIGGRQDHPDRSGQLIKEHGDLFYDTETRYNIYDVARVHGGASPKYGRDTFRGINVDRFVSPRLRLLAAILRLGDELSENPERVPQELRRWFQTSPESNLAFRYAESFRRFDLQQDTLNILFSLYPEQHEYRAQTGGAYTSFFQHLERKIDVIENEVRYCSQYGRPDLDIRRIVITIEYYPRSFPSECTNRSTLTLHLDRGYPEDLVPLVDRCCEVPPNTTFQAFCGGGA